MTLSMISVGVFAHREYGRRHDQSDAVLRDAVMICEFLRTVDLFKHLTPTELINIAEKMKRRCYSKDETIIRESRARHFFLIGHVFVDVRRCGTEAEERLVATLGVGDVFGERALSSMSHATPPASPPAIGSKSSPWTRPTSSTCRIQAPALRNRFKLYTSSAHR